MLNGVSSAPSPPSPSTMSGFRQVRLLHSLSGRIGLFSVEKTQPSFLLTKALPGRRVLPPESQLPTFPAPPFRCPFLGSSASLQPNGERDSHLCMLFSLAYLLGRGLRFPKSFWYGGRKQNILIMKDKERGLG